jgi:hypothetical protein
MPLELDEGGLTTDLFGKEEELEESLSFFFVICFIHPKRRTGPPLARATVWNVRPGQPPNT